MADAIVLDPEALDQRILGNDVEARPAACDGTDPDGDRTRRTTRTMKPPWQSPRVARMEGR